jgi:uncharacterized membrane protein
MMDEEPSGSRLDRVNKIIWLVCGIVTVILVVVIMVTVMVRGTGY